jgi:hypothetical protein
MSRKTRTARWFTYFQTKNPNLGKFWGTIPRLENVDIFYGHLEYLMAIGNILRTFGILYDHLVYF